ncbi:hypothetical protein F5Y15DRAFT_400797 [Xylariaceae sp. FL0016]|nr:hypothetical protein F5Y15DRAFT_400797 [Xylariaceae sp. FL0016]
MGKDRSLNKKVPAKKGPAAQNPPARTTTANTAAQLPDWPAFKPKLPVAVLDFESPRPEFHDQILLLHNFWPKSMCRDYISFLRGLPLTTTPGRPKRGEATRVNDRFQVQDPIFSRRLWLETGLKETVLDESVSHLWGGEVLGLNPNIRIYRYSKGQFFDCHYDDSNHLSLPSNDDPSQLVSARTVWTLLLYLSSSVEGCMGGETCFYPNDRKSAEEELVIGPETGMLLLHKHGENCLLHEGREVSAGEKWILRSDLCVRR